MIGQEIFVLFTVLFVGGGFYVFGHRVGYRRGYGAGRGAGYQIGRAVADDIARQKQKP